MTKLKEGLEAKKLAEATINLVKNSGENIKKVITIDKKGPHVNVVEALAMAMKLPGATIDREKFLRKELRVCVDTKKTNTAIEHNPAYAGIPTSKINKIAKTVIGYERNRVSLISVVSALPPGYAVLIGISCDLIQYFYHVIRVSQKLAYLYGYEQFKFDENDISDDEMNRLLLFVGVMYGAKGASTAINVLANAVKNNLINKLGRVALKKQAYYNVLRIALGRIVTRKLLQKAVGIVVPVVGGFVSGGITFVSFNGSCNNLMKKLASCDLAKPNTYKKINKKSKK